VLATKWEIRASSPRHSILAAFEDGFDGSPRECLAAWNSRYPRRAYSRLANLQRDAKDAQGRILSSGEYWQKGCAGEGQGHWAPSCGPTGKSRVLAVKLVKTSESQNVDLRKHLLEDWSG
jgi:hypothetical protein